ncbi:MAG: hypothetical protein R6V58_01880, partial [Planctomycetota bacterium]
MEHLVVLERAVLDRHNDGRLADGVVGLRVDADVAREPRHRVYLLQGVSDGCGIGRASLLNGGHQHPHGVVGHDGVDLDVFAELLFVGGAVLLDVLGVDVRVIHEVAALDGRGGHLQQGGRGPAVAADEGNGDAQVAGLLGGQSHLLGQEGHDDHVWLGVLDRCELSAELDVTGLEGLVGYQLATQLLPSLHEEVAQTDGVVGADLIEHGGLLGLQVAEGEISHDGPLIGVGEADPEGVLHQHAFLRLGHARVGGVGADDGDLILLGDGRHGDVRPAAVGADDGHHIILGDQAFDRQALRVCSRIQIQRKNIHPVK